MSAVDFGHKEGSCIMETALIVAARLGIAAYKLSLLLPARRPATGGRAQGSQR